MAHIIQRSAVGRSGHLGALYDCRSDSFQGDNAFKCKIEEDDIYQTELGNTTVELLMYDSLEDKFHKLNIEAELSVSILAGLIKLSGSAKFLDEKRTSEKKSTMSLIYNVKTMTEEIYLRQLKHIVDLDALESTEATHVLTSIEWGAMCTVTAEYSFSDEDEKKIIEGRLKASLNLVKGILDKLEGEAKVDFNETLKGKQKNFKFYSKCDVGSRQQDLPVTFQEAVEQAKQLPSLVKATNEGKGVPLKFILTPLSVVKKWFKVQSQVNVIFKTINEQTLHRIVSVVQRLTETVRKLYDLREEIMNGRAWITDEDIHTVTDIVTEFAAYEAGFKDKLQGLLKDVRSDKKEISELEGLAKELEEGKFSPCKMEEEMSKWEHMRNKIAAVIKAQDKGVKYFGKAGNINYSEKADLFVLYTENILLDSSAKAFFWQLHDTMANKSDILFCIVDLSIKHNVEFEDKETVAYYKSGRLVCADYMFSFGGGCLIQFTVNEFCDRLPNNRAKVNLKCPAKTGRKSQCSNNEKEWLCSECKDPIWYGVKTRKYYCDRCQKQCDPTETLYRCDELSHGLDFIKYPNRNLIHCLSQLRESAQINILILGETGVGKSTWVNSFTNYLYFDSLDAAMEGNKESPVVAIPSQFTVYDDGLLKTIFVGKKDDNEVHTVGVSNTQQTRTYPFTVGGYTVNLIDTPGIGDTRGIHQDDKNMEDILSHISFYDEIHAILVLLKPNNARLGVFFKHCIQQLLAHLHRDAAENIVFVFTNTRQTFYQPGETLPALRKLLKDRQLGIEAVSTNMFCYDNEAFRFLACGLQGMEFKESVKADYAKSWERALDETKRLLNFIHRMRPHAVKNTITLNDSRRIIVELSRPLQEFADTIRKNIKNMEFKQREAEDLGNDANKFQANLMFEGVTLEQSELNFPRTVCTHDNCVEYVPVGRDMVKQINYITHCHPRCGLGEQVRPEVVGDERLMGCSAMIDNVCRKCGHSYNIHMHRTYDLIRVKKQFISDEVQAKINAVHDKKKQAEMRRHELEKLVNELKAEEVAVRDIAAEFAAFLKTFAIIPFNDAMGEYIEHMLKEEEDKPTQDKAAIAGLRKYKAAYEKQKQIIEKALNEIRDTDEGKADAAQNIKKLQARVFGLKHFGQDVKAVFNKIDARKNNSPSFACGYVPRRPKSSKKGLMSTFISWWKKW